MFKVGKTWKQPKCSSTEEQRKNMWPIYTMDPAAAAAAQVQWTPLLPPLLRCNGPCCCRCRRSGAMEPCCCCRRSGASVVSDSVRPHRRQPTRLPRPWDPPGKNTGVGCHFLLQCMKVNSLSRVQLLVTPWTAAHQAPPSMGFARQEYWSGLPLPSPRPQGYIH